MLLLFLVVTILHFRTSHETRLTERFVCENNACAQSKSTSESSYDSIELCQLVCGRYSNLWPMPTGAHELGQTAVKIDPKTVEVIIDNEGSDESKKYLDNVNASLPDGPLPDDSLPDAFLPAECHPDASLHDVSLPAAFLPAECHPDAFLPDDSIPDFPQDPAISKLFLSRLCRGCEPKETPSTQVQVHLRAKKDDLTLDTDTSETYKISITTNENLIEAFVEGETVYGVRHGLETLLQLTARISTNDNCSVSMLTKAAIEDAPLFKHRGILIDTARNFIPLPDLKRTIDGMASVKLNVLHWHAVDAHSFPLELKKLPQMAETGAYSSSETYSVADQEELIEYAKLRGVRIILEINTPAHAGNGWTWGPEADMGELVLCAYKEPWIEYCVQPPCGQLNPINPNTYKVLGDIFEEVNGRFPVNMFHMGGYKVKFECWNSSDSIRDYVSAKDPDLSTNTFTELWGEFHKKALTAWDTAVGHSDTNIILWTSDLTQPDGIPEWLDPKRFIIQYWALAESDVPDRLLKMGYRLIFSTKDNWSLDHGFWGDTKYHTWKIVYNYKIPNLEQVLGGEVSMWSEFVDQYSLDAKIWPRAAAVAERLWSDPKTIEYGISGDENQVEYRLARARDRLLRLGINADQTTPRWCYLNQNKCK
ncbi:beta-hexosaminidase [Nesidiocoris tenuis]|uniref:beta-N-acetylhexosaminidase n=1 Tax=Nesidiocoris tenuis TaxID=355587 RepID=A0ABN7B6W4_9HEMI|nr:beta-hexosaminidase [Nesidiocoris tenuis]